MTISRRALLGSGILATAVPAVAWAEPASYRDPRLPITERVRDLIGRMTIEEKVAQLRVMWIGKFGILDAQGAFSEEKATKALGGGIGQISRPADTMGTSRFRTERNLDMEASVPLVNAIQKFLTEKTRLGIPAMFHDETAHGLAARDATIFPVAPALASTWDPGLVERVFTVVAREARLRGNTLGLSPVLDLVRDARFGRADESFGEDPWLTGQLGIAAVRGMQGRTRPLGPDRIFATLKHFVHGTPAGGLNIAPAETSERALYETYLVPFAHTIRRADPAFVMVSYNEVEGIPAHASRHLLQDIGRARLGFKGVYLSDYNGVGNLVDHHHVAADPSEAAVMALNAGVDVDFSDAPTYASLPAAVRAGKADVARIDAAVARVLALKFEAGLFEDPYIDLKRARRFTNTAADVALARTAAQKALVLLKNDGLLPLDERASIRIAVIGPNVEEPLLGGYSGENRKAVGILAGLRGAAPSRVTIDYAEGVRITEPDARGMHAPRGKIQIPAEADNRARIAAAAEVASRADIVLLVLGDNAQVTREATQPTEPGDRATLGLFGMQDAMVEAIAATGKPIATLLLNGRPLAVPRLAEVSRALIEGWYLGQEGGTAFADVLFGRVNPGGKLAVSIPRSVGQLPVNYDRHPSALVNRYIEETSEPLFPFGHGLSYTTFDISAPRPDKTQVVAGEPVVVSVDVTNTGKRAGDEVVQVYIRDMVSSVPRPVLELRAFERVTLKPGETKTLRFVLDGDSLRFYDAAMRFVVEPGLFQISAGASSKLLKTADVTVVAA